GDRYQVGGLHAVDVGARVVRHADLLRGGDHPVDRADQGPRGDRLPRRHARLVVERTEGDRPPRRGGDRPRRGGQVVREAGGEAGVRTRRIGLGEQVRVTGRQAGILDEVEDLRG